MRLPTRSVSESSTVGLRMPATRGGCSDGLALERIGIEKIGGEQGDAFFVVARVEDMADGFERPGRRLAGSDVVEDQNFGFQHRLQDAHFRRLIFGVVAVLNSFQKFAVIVEKAAVAAQDNRFQGGNGEMGFAHAAGTHQQDAVLALHAGNRRIFLGETLHEQFGLSQAAIPVRPVARGWSV